MKLTIDIDLSNETHRQILRLLLDDKPITTKKAEPSEEPKKAEPSEEPKQQKPEEIKPAEEMSADALRAIVVEAHKKIGKPDANAIVKKYGAGISKIDPSEYQACVDELKKAMADA